MGSSGGQYTRQSLTYLGLEFGGNVNDEPQARTAGGDALIVVHRLASIAVVALAFAVAWALRAQRAIALSVAAAALAALAMGVATTLRQPSLAFTFAHNACAALLIASLATAAARRA